MWRRFIEWLKDPYAKAREQAEREVEAVGRWIEGKGSRPW